MEKKTFDYLENVDFAATVCDKDGIVLYQNACARKRDGDVVGKNLFGCHKKATAEFIRQMIDAGKSNTYEVIRHGKRKLLHQTPWFEEPSGAVAGLVEIAIDLPKKYTVLNKGDE